MPRLQAVRRRLLGDQRGVALIEFAYTLPIVVLMAMGGAELASYTTTRMRVSQLALHVADNAARMGNGTQLQAKTITEADINDVFTGVQLQSGKLDLQRKGRVILSSLEPVANPNTGNRYKIVWQRCFGQKVHASTYGIAGQTNMVGMGPAGRQIRAQDGNATMFVEVYYEYDPLVSPLDAPSTTMVEVASMAVRDRRDLTDDTAAGALATHPKGIYNPTNEAKSTC